MKSKSLYFLIIIVLLSCFHFELEAKGKLILRGSNNYPPLDFIDQEGKPAGFNVEIIRAVMKEMGREYDLQLGNLEPIIDSLKTNQIDIVIGMIYTPNRAHDFRFSLPICTVNQSYITRKKDNYTNVSELKGKTIIVARGGRSQQYLQQNKITDKIIESKNIYESLQLLNSGKYDAIITTDIVALNGINELNMKGFVVKDLGIAPQNYSIIVNQESGDLIYQINLALQRLKLSGEYDKIYSKWFGIYEQKGYSQTLLLYMGVFFCILITLVLFVVTLRKQVAKSTHLLKESKQELAMAIDAGQISAWSYNIEEEILIALHGLLLLDSTSITIKDLLEMMHPDDVELVSNAHRDLIAGNKQEMFFTFRAKQTSTSPYRYYESRMKHIPTEKNHQSRIVGTLKDITEEVNLEAILEEFRVKTEFIIRVNDIILSEYDITSQSFIRLNDVTYMTQTIYSIEDYIENVHPEDREIAKTYIDVLNEGKLMSIESEFRIISEDGSYRWYTICVKAYKFDANKEIISYLGIRRNNTKWKETTNDLIRLKEEADASNKLKSAFLANMSHEIRTPLNAIVGFSELLPTIEDEVERDEFVLIIKKNNELLLQLINDVLDLSRIEAGYTNLTLSHFDFPSFIDEHARSLKLKETNDVKLLCTNNYTNFDVYSDKNRLAQVIINFVSNAFKFTKSGSITISYRLEKNGIKVIVSDTGIGISKENLSRVFNRFEKLNEFAQGTGLGLSICKVIIEALNGNIGVDSEEGKGASFWFWVPIDQRDK